MWTRHAVTDGPHRLLELRPQFRRQYGRVLLVQQLGLADGQLVVDLALLARLGDAAERDAAVRREVDHLDRLHRAGDLGGDGVGVEAVRVALPVAADRRDDGHDVLVEEGFEEVGVDALDLAGVLVVDAGQDAGGVGDDGVAHGPSQVGGGQPLEEFVRDVRGREEGELERRVVGDARAVEVAGGGARCLGEPADLVGRAVDEADADAQGAQQGDVEQEVAEVLALDDRAVERDDEEPVAEERDVAENFAKVLDAMRAVVSRVDRSGCRTRIGCS